MIMPRCGNVLATVSGALSATLQPIATYAWTYTHVWVYTRTHGQLVVVVVGKGRGNMEAKFETKREGANIQLQMPIDSRL